MYPEYAEIDGREYKIDTDYKTALKCFEVIEDDEITDTERAIAIVYLLFDFIPKWNIEVFLKKAILFLQCGEDVEQQKSKKKDMDFIQDKKYILASFRSDYHIDLSKENMHFWEYIDLIQGLTEETILSKIRKLRTLNLNDIKDLKLRSEIAEAQKEVSLKTRKSCLTIEQKKNIDNFYQMTNIERRN